MRLKKQHGMPISPVMERLPDLSGLAPADKDTLIRSLHALVRELQGRLELLEGENRKLRGQLSKDSMNSSKPPSSDGLRKKTRSLRSKSERPAGGVSGHPGHHLKRSDTPDHIINHEPPSHCDTCGRIPEAHGFEARQVFELPRVKLEVTGHRAWSARCSCGRRHQAEFPEPLKAAVQHRPRLKAFAACLHHHHMVPVERTADILESLCGVRPSGGTVLNFVEEAASRIEPTWERIGQALRHTPVLGADESGMRTAGKAWLHVLTNPLLSWLGVHSKRGREAFDEFGLLPDFDGTLVHDGFVSYKGCSCRHALCNAHHLRELKFEAEENQQAWAEEMSKLLCRALKDTRNSPRGLPRDLRQRIRRECETLIRKGCKLNPPEPPDGWPGKHPRAARSTCCAAWKNRPMRCCASRRTLAYPSATTTPNVRCACPRSSSRSPAHSERGMGPGISASCAPASQRSKNRGSTCSTASKRLSGAMTPLTHSLCEPTCPGF